MSIDTIQGYWKAQSQDFSWLVSPRQEFLVFCYPCGIKQILLTRSGGALRDHRLMSDTPARRKGVVGYELWVISIVKLHLTDN